MLMKADYPGMDGRLLCILQHYLVRKNVKNSVNVDLNVAGY